MDKPKSTGATPARVAHLPTEGGGTVEVLAEVLDQLRGLGYRVETWEQAVDAVRAAYATSGLEVPALLTGVSDTEEVQP